MTWRNDNLPLYHATAKLKPLTDAMFDRILPLGVSQLVTGGTYLMWGQPRSGHGHLFINKPEKLSSVQTFVTGLSDQNLIKVTTFANVYKN